MILLTVNKLRDILGTCRTKERSIDDEKGTKPFQDMDDEDPSAILTLSLPEHVESGEKKAWEPVI